jgi:hypothetical protein
VADSRREMVSVRDVVTEEDTASTEMDAVLDGVKYLLLVPSGVNVTEGEAVALALDRV